MSDDPVAAVASVYLAWFFVSLCGIWVGTMCVLIWVMVDCPTWRRKKETKR